ncbi:hypothetical protein [Nonomuraea sp. KM88]
MRFEGACGPLNLGELLEAFRDFARDAGLTDAQTG